MIALATSLAVLPGCTEQSGPASALWTPEPGEAADWDWQIAEPYDLTAPRAMYDLNPLGNDPGFDITLADQHAWYREVAAQAHARGLSVGMKNGHDQPGSAAVLVDHFDWALPEECAEFDECTELDVFVERGKAVFAVDYQESVDEPAACDEQRRHDFDGLVKDEPPTGAQRTSCR